MNKNRLVVSALILVCLASPAMATDYTWTGNSSNLWGLAGNWGGTAFPNAATDTATLTGTKNPTISLNNTAYSLKTLTFNTTGTTAFTVGTGTLNLAAGGSIVKNATSSDNNSTVSAALSLAGNATFSNAATGGYWTKELIISGPITGSGTITVSGTADDSTVKLSGNNTSFTGAVTLTKGQLIVSNNNALGSASVATTLAGGTIWLDGSSAGNLAENFTISGPNTMNTFGGGWGMTGTITVNSGQTWTVENGGGNGGSINGVLAGPGNVTFSYGGESLGGTSSNTLSGKVLCNTGSGTTAYQTLTLNKTGGATAIAGALETQNNAIVSWSQNNQVADTSPITLGGGTLAPNGHTDTLGTLTLTGKGNIDMGGGNSVLRFADSHSQAWTAGSQMLIKNWGGSATDNLYIGSSASSLTSTQLGMIGFTNPTGRAAGLYRADITSAGELVPSANAVVPVNPPFDVSATAIATRTAIYDIHGRDNLGAVGTPLKANMKISFFGDSITWQNNYITNINNALAAGAGSKNLAVKLFNHGINGGGVLQVRDGSPDSAYDGGSNSAPQAAFASVIAADHSDVAVVFIGINDVWWRGTSAADFEKGLRDIVAAGKANNTTMVLATMTVHGELPNGGNADDTKIEQFSQITRTVASSTGTTLVDLRKVYMAYLQNNNWNLQLDGSLTFQSSGILTYDGVHPTDIGNAMLADHLSQGIYTALTVPEPATMTLLAAGAGLLLRKRTGRRNGH